MIDDIIRMAQEAGMVFDGVNTKVPLWISKPEELERFAALVAAAEREAIDRIVWNAPFDEAMNEEELESEVGDAMKAMAFRISAAIRARGQG